MRFARLLHGAVEALFPATWAFAYQIPTGFLLAYLILRSQADESVSNRTLRQVAATVAIGGGGLSFLAFVLGHNIVTALLAVVIMWVGTSFTLDKYLGVDWESSQRLTGLVCGPIWLVWIILGAVLRLAMTGGV